MLGLHDNKKKLSYESLGSFQVVEKNVCMSAAYCTVLMSAREQSDIPNVWLMSLVESTKVA